MRLMAINMLNELGRGNAIGEHFALTSAMSRLSPGWTRHWVPGAGRWTSQYSATAASACVPIERYLLVIRYPTRLTSLPCDAGELTCMYIRWPARSQVLPSIAICLPAKYMRPDRPPMQHVPCYTYNYMMCRGPHRAAGWTCGGGGAQ